MREKILRVMALATGLCFVLSLVAMTPVVAADSSSGIITVEGTNNPDLTTFVHPLWGTPCTEDIYNVQKALFFAQPHDTLVLNGEFCFDTEFEGDAGVYILNPITIILIDHRTKGGYSQLCSKPNLHP